MPISDKPFNDYDALLADDPSVARLYLPQDQQRDQALRDRAFLTQRPATAKVDERGNCIHVSYTEQAGGFIICDYCCEDVTSEIFRSAR